MGSKNNILDDSIPSEGAEWKTVAEILEENKISWKVYQETDNFDDNAFAWFTNFKNSKKGDPIFDKGMIRSKSVIDDFTNDVNNNSIAQVSFIVAPAWLSEHATNHPQDGEELSSRLIQALGNNKEL